MDQDVDTNDCMTDENRANLKRLSVLFGRDITKFGDLYPIEVELIVRLAFRD